MPQASNWESAIGIKPSTVSWKDLQDIQNAAYDRDQKRGLDELFSQNIDSKGNLNEHAFYTGVAARGLNPEAAREAMKYYQDQKKADVATQIANQTLRMYGANPNAGGRNGAQIGEPENVLKTWWDEVRKKAKSETTPGSDIVASRQENVQSPEFTGMTTGGSSEQPSTAAPAITTGDQSGSFQPKSQEEIDADRRYQLAKYLGMDKYTKLMQENPGIVNIIADEQPSTAAPANNSDVSVGNAYNPTGSGNNTGSFTLPEDTTKYPSSFTPGVDNRSRAQMIEDSYDPSKSMMDPRTMAAQGGTAGEPDATLFTWNPSDVTGNQYQQFATALNTKLKSSGFVNAKGDGDASAYLKSVYDSAYQANMPAAPNPLLAAQGLEGQVKYGQELQAYQAGLAKAKGEATKAVIAAKDKLTEMAKEYGTQTVEQRKSEIGDSGDILRDPSKRNEAAAIRANEVNISEVIQSMKAIDKQNGGDAAKNMAQYRLLAPQVVRLYATGVNPGQQLNEGNLKEVMDVMYPELVGRKDYGDALARAAVYIVASKDKAKAFDDQVNKLVGTFDAQDPAKIQARIKRMVGEAAAINSNQYDNYMIRKTPAKKTTGNGTSEGLSQSSSEKSSSKPAGTAKKNEDKMDGKKVIDHIKKKTKKNDPLGIL